MEKEIIKIPNSNSNENSNNIIKSGIFINNKRGGFGMLNRIRILYICENYITYYPFPNDKNLTNP